MKHILKIISVIILTTTVISCSKDSSEEYNETLETKTEDFLITNYGITTTDLGNGNLELIYPDGLKLNIENKNGVYLMSGSKISDKLIELKINERNDIISSFTFTTEISYESTSNFARTANENSSNSNSSFGDYFKKQWNSFCSDFVSCVAQITNPHAVAGAIVIACQFFAEKLDRVERLEYSPSPFDEEADLGSLTISI